MKSLFEFGLFLILLTGLQPRPTKNFQLYDKILTIRAIVAIICMIGWLLTSNR